MVEVQNLKFWKYGFESHGGHHQTFWKEKLTVKDEKIFTYGNMDRTKVTYSEMIKVIADYIRANPNAE